MDQTGSWGRVPDVEAADPRRGTPYWDFSGFGKLDTMESLFLEAAHFWPAVGHTMLRQFLGLGCGPCGATAETIRAAGVRADRSTVDAHLGRQETARTAVQRQGNRCARVIGEMLQKRGGTVATRAGSGSEPVRR
jgi:hypothetical protein